MLPVSVAERSARPDERAPLFKGIVLFDETAGALAQHCLFIGQRKIHEWISVAELELGDDILLHLARAAVNGRRALEQKQR